jgi:hypothetical protein
VHDVLVEMLQAAASARAATEAESMDADFAAAGTEP